MLVAVLLALLQHPAAPAAFPVTKVEITPPAAEIEIGQTVRLAARALDARGQPVTGAAIAWYSGGTEGDVDSTGLVKGGYNGYVRVTAGACVPGQQGPGVGGRSGRATAGLPSPWYLACPLLLCKKK